MPLKDRITFLTTPEQVDQFLAANKAAVIFKAGTCHKTPSSFEHVQAQLDGPGRRAGGGHPRGGGPAGQQPRGGITGIRHESPQLILFKDGKPVFDRDNWDIDEESLAEALQDHFAPAGSL